MGRPWCSIRNRLKPRVSGSKRVTTSCAKKICRNSQRKKNRTCKPGSNDAKFIAQFGFWTRYRGKRGGEKRSQSVHDKQGRQTKAVVVGARERDWSAV